MAPLSSAYRTLQVAGYMAKGKDVPVDLLVKAQASTLLLVDYWRHGRHSKARV